MRLGVTSGHSQMRTIRLVRPRREHGGGEKPTMSTTKIARECALGRVELHDLVVIELPRESDALSPWKLFPEQRFRLREAAVPVGYREQVRECA